LAKKRCGRFPELDKFTQKAQEALFKAQQLGRDFNHQAIEPAHLLLALLQQG
jgi:ATP-dependent Clp protease ATP-binding subunit ClpB